MSCDITAHSRSSQAQSLTAIRKVRALQGSGKMGRKHPRILGSLRNPLPPQSSPPSVCPNGTHLFPSQTLSPQPTSPTNPLSVFYPTSFPPLKNTSYFPTLMVAMPSSSCIDKLCSKSPSFLTPNSCCSTVMTTSAQAASLDSCLDSLSHQEAQYLRTAWVSQKPQTGNSCRGFTSEMP